MYIYLATIIHAFYKFSDTINSQYFCKFFLIVHLTVTKNNYYLYKQNNINGHIIYINYTILTVFN
jgi:hypothetical protein